MLEQILGFLPYKEVFKLTKDICDIKQLATYLKISIPEVRKLLREKKIPHFRLGNRYRFDINKINKWLEEMEEKESRKSLFY